MTTAEAAERMGYSPRQVRRMLQDGRIHGTKIGKDYEIDAATIDNHKKYERRGRQPRSVPCVTPASCWWADNHIGAQEVARIAQQIYRTPSEIGAEEISEGEFFWWVRNPAVTDPDAWAEIAVTAYRFLREQGIWARTRLTAGQVEGVPDAIGEPIYKSKWVDGRPRLDACHGK